MTQCSIYCSAVYLGAYFGYQKLPLFCVYYCLSVSIYVPSWWGCFMPPPIYGVRALGFENVNPPAFHEAGGEPPPPHFGREMGGG